MIAFLALLDGMLSDLRDSRVSAAPTDRPTLAPVWVMPMIRCSQSRPEPAAR